MNIVFTSSAHAAASVFASRNRPHFRTRLALAGLSAYSLVALAWTAFVQPLPRLAYNPSDSVAIGWYRVEPLNHHADSLPRPLSVGSIVLTRLPSDAAALAARAVQTHPRCTSRCFQTCRKHVPNVPGLRPLLRLSACCLLTPQRRRPAAAESESDRQRRKARQKGAAPVRLQHLSARGGSAARSGFAAVLLGVRTPRQYRHVRVLRTAGHAVA